MLDLRTVQILARRMIITPTVEKAGGDPDDLLLLSVVIIYVSDVRALAATAVARVCRFLMPLRASRPIRALILWRAPTLDSAHLATLVKSLCGGLHRQYMCRAPVLKRSPYC